MRCPTGRTEPAWASTLRHPTFLVVQHSEFPADQTLGRVLRVYVRSLLVCAGFRALHSNADPAQRGGGIHIPCSPRRERFAHSSGAAEGSTIDFLCRRRRPCQTRWG